MSSPLQHQSRLGFYVENKMATIRNCYFSALPLYPAGKHPRHMRQHNSLVPCPRILRQIRVHWHPHVVRWRSDCREIPPGNYLQFSLPLALEQGWDLPYDVTVQLTHPHFVDVGGPPDLIEQQMNTLFPISYNIQPCSLNGTASRHKSHLVLVSCVSQRLRWATGPKRASKETALIMAGVVLKFTTDNKKLLSKPFPALTHKVHLEMCCS